MVVVPFSTSIVNRSHPVRLGRVFNVVITKYDVASSIVSVGNVITPIVKGNVAVVQIN